MGSNYEQLLFIIKKRWKLLADNLAVAKLVSDSTEVA